MEKSQDFGIRLRMLPLLLVLAFSQCSPLLADVVLTDEQWKNLKASIANSSGIQNSSEETIKILNETSEKDEELLQEEERIAKEDHQLLSHSRERIKSLERTLKEQENSLKRLKRGNSIVFVCTLIGSTFLGALIGSSVSTSLAPRLVPLK